MLEWFVSSAVLTAALIALRALLRGRLSPKLQYTLWLLALVRLLVPVSIGKTAVSVGNLLPQAAPAVRTTQPAQTADAQSSPARLPQQFPVQAAAAPQTMETPAKRPADVWAVLKTVWLVGGCADRRLVRVLQSALRAQAEALRFAESPGRAGTARGPACCGG